MSERFTSFFCDSLIMETCVTLNVISRLNKNAALVYYEPDDGEKKCVSILWAQKRFTWTKPKMQSKLF